MRMSPHRGGLAEFADTENLKKALEVKTSGFAPKAYRGANRHLAGDEVLTTQVALLARSPIHVTPPFGTESMDIEAEISMRA